MDIMDAILIMGLVFSIFFMCIYGFEVIKTYIKEWLNE